MESIAEPWTPPVSVGAAQTLSFVHDANAPVHSRTCRLVEHGGEPKKALLYARRRRVECSDGTVSSWQDYMFSLLSKHLPGAGRGSGGTMSVKRRTSGTRCVIYVYFYGNNLW